MVYMHNRLVPSLESGKGGSESYSYSFSRDVETCGVHVRLITRVLEKLGSVDLLGLERGIEG